MTGRILKYLRVAVSALFLALVTAGVVGAPALLVAPVEWSREVQLVPAVMSFSLGVFIVWVMVTIVLGRIYCSSVCPLGTMQDIIASLRRGRVYRYAPSRSYIAVGLLVLMVAVTAIGSMVLVELLDPYREYTRMVGNVIDPRLAGAVIAVVTLGVVGVMAWKGGRLYCNTVCPVGGALGIISRNSFMHIEIDPDRCIRCRKCVDRCKAQCIEIDTCVVDTSRCVCCFNCLPVCPNDAISYTPDRKQLMTPMFQRSERRKAPALTATGCQSCSKTDLNKDNNHTSRK